MRNTKTTKYALVSSVISIFLCAVMLIGTTFAWFTDEANTNVNTIQAGTLDLTFEDAAGADLEGASLAWVKADGSENVLWEPGCTYETSAAYIKNEGNLAFKYKIGVNGIKGNAILLDVVDFSILVGEDEVNLEEFEGKLLPGEKTKFAIVAHMDEEAGNEYQNHKIENLSVVIKATQLDYEYDSNGNDYDKDATVDDINGKKIIILTDENSADAINVADDEDVILDMNNKTLTNVIVNNGKLDAAGGDIDFTGTAITNNGEAIFADIDMNIGDAANYGIIARAGSTTTFNNVNIVSGGGAIGATDGAKVVFNSGSIHVDSDSTSGRYLFYAEGEGSEITINGGKFSWDKNDNTKRAYVYANSGTTVYITGGTFGAASTRSGYTAGILGNGTVIITGGTFGFNPSAWLAPGYVAVEADGVWTVSAE